MKRSIDLVQLVLLVCCLVQLQLAHAATVPWQRVPIVSAAIRSQGYSGGEGCQVIRDLAIARSDPDFMLMGTDVGGLYSSHDGGRNWTVAMVGFNSRGAAGFAIDPFNASHALALGGNSANFGTVNGLYISVDKAASWRQVLPMGDLASALTGSPVAFDPSSFDPSRGMCMIAYFSSANNGMYRSTDGGFTWSNVSPNASSSVVRVHPTKGIVYAASTDYRTYGFYRSTDGFKTFTRNVDYILGLDVPNATNGSPDDVYISRWDGVLVSHDAGQNFGYVGSNKGLPADQPIQRITVSPANASHMTAWLQGNNYNYMRWYTVDGGNNWLLSQWDNRLSFMPYNNRAGVTAFHPYNASIVFGVGGDWITRSDDAGATFAWQANGYNAVMLGGTFAFNPQTPNLLFLSFQDYSGAVTADGGQTWIYMNVSGFSWGGFVYGGLAISTSTFAAGNASSWGGPRALTVTHDGGNTWAAVRDSAGKTMYYSGADAVTHHPTLQNVAFVSNFRTADGGQTWQNMTGCSSVYTAASMGSAGTLAFFGAGLSSNNQAAVVVSTDDGSSWRSLVSAPGGGIQDLAYDNQTQKLFVASSDNNLYACQSQAGGAWQCSVVDLPLDQYNRTRLKSVAIDPSNSARICVGQATDIYATFNAVVCSQDHGQSWTVMLSQAPVLPGVPQGPHEVGWLRFHPVTGELWVAGECFGMWKVQL